MNAIEFARLLRKSSSDAERHLWFHLRDRRLAGYKFRRQVSIGPYVVDFFCEAASLVIELDGGQHAQERAYDERRDAFLRQQGCNELRFWNNDVLGNTDGVLEVVLRKLAERPLTRASRDLCCTGMCECRGRMDAQERLPRGEVKGLHSPGRYLRSVWPSN